MVTKQGCFYYYYYYYFILFIYFIKWVCSDIYVFHVEQNRMVWVSLCCWEGSGSKQACIQYVESWVAYIRNGGSVGSIGIILVEGSSVSSCKTKKMRWSRPEPHLRISTMLAWGKLRFHPEGDKKVVNTIKCRSSSSKSFGFSNLISIIWWFSNFNLLIQQHIHYYIGLKSHTHAQS